MVIIIYGNNNNL